MASNRKKYFEDNILESKSLLFIPRIIYGHYLQDLFQKTIVNLQEKAVKLKIFSKEVSKIVPHAASIELISKNNSKHYDYVILATGYKVNQKTGQILLAEDVIQQLKLKAQEKLKNIDQDSETKRITINIGIKGSSLSAIDHIKLLTKDGYFIQSQAEKDKLNYISPEYFLEHCGNKIPIEFKITMFSRTGILPKVRTLLPKPKIEVNTEEIKKIKNFKELRLFYEKTFKQNFNSELNWSNLFQQDSIIQLKKDFKEALSHHEMAKLQYLFYATVDHVAEILDKNFTLEDVNKVLAFKSRFQAFIAPMPDQTARELIALHDKNILQIKSQDSLNADFDLLIDATGHKNPFIENLNGLEESLIDNKIVKIDPKMNHVLRGENKSILNDLPASKNLYLIGAASGHLRSSRAKQAIDEGYTVAQDIAIKAGLV